MTTPYLLLRLGHGRGLSLHELPGVAGYAMVIFSAVAMYAHKRGTDIDRVWLWFQLGRLAVGLLCVLLALRISSASERFTIWIWIGALTVMALHAIIRHGGRPPEK